MNILQMLQQSDMALLTALVEVWSVKLSPRAEISDIVDQLFRAMTDPVRAETVWDMLDDKARGALHLLLGTNGQMPESKFVRVFGEIRRFGEGAIRRELPHKNPTTVAEALYYRGLIGFGFENGDSGLLALIVVPSDLAAVLPLKKTSYSAASAADTDLPLEAGDDDSPALEPLSAESVTQIQAADTSLVDDMTTLLAYLRIRTPLVAGDSLANTDAEAILPYLLKTDESRLNFLLGVGVAADIIEIANGRVIPSRTGTPKWLSKSRHEQVRVLAEAWRGSNHIDLLYVPGLSIDLEAGSFSQYNPAIARTTVLDIMTHTLPPTEWWSIDRFVEMIHEDSLDFQRPDGNFDSWYIYDESDKLLTGIDNWHSIEGALLEFYCALPLHSLGLLDLGADAARLTTYGRAFLGMTPWPTTADAPAQIEITPDATFRLSRRVSRADRYQVARFCSWMAVSGDGYTYKLDRTGIAQGEAQGITIGHIEAFIKRALGDKPLPDALARLLEQRTAATVAATAPGGATAVSVERLLVLRTTAPETLEFIINTPALRRYTGARLGEMAVVIRAPDLDAFTAALEAHGIKPDFIGG